MNAPIEDIQKQAPINVIISQNPSDLPCYRLTPTVRTVLRRQSNGDVRFILLAQSTTGGSDWIISAPDILGINGETQIGLSRANRILPGAIATAPSFTSRIGRSPGNEQNSNGEVKRSNNEIECREKYLCAAERRVRTNGTETFTVNNPRAFGPLVHQLVCTRKHIERFDEVTIAQLRDATEVFFELAKESSHSFSGACDGLTIGMNCGSYVLCGASQPHFHYQVAGLGKANHNAGDRLAALCHYYGQLHHGADYLEDYQHALRKAELIVAEKEGIAIAYVPISQRFKNEVQIMLLRKQAGNIIETTPEERAAIAELQHDIIHRFDRLGCEALNQVWYMTRFSSDNSYGQRLIISLCPRAAVLAFYELAGNNVIDSLPWEAAKTIKKAANNPINHEPR